MRSICGNIFGTFVAPAFGKFACGGGGGSFGVYNDPGASRASYLDNGEPVGYDSTTASHGCTICVRCLFFWLGLSLIALLILRRSA